MWLVLYREVKRLGVAVCLGFFWGVFLCLELTRNPDVGLESSLLTLQFLSFMFMAPVHPPPSIPSAHWLYLKCGLEEPGSLKMADCDGKQLTFRDEPSLFPPQSLVLSNPLDTFTSPPFYCTPSFKTTILLSAAGIGYPCVNLGQNVFFHFL